MILHDVNIWVYAFRNDSPYCLQAREAIEDAISRGEQFLFCPAVAASFIRLVTNKRIFTQPSSAAEAWSFVEALQDHPAAVFASIDPMTFGIFKHICLVNRENGNSIPDAVLAALAIRHEAVLLTADSDFSRYHGLMLKML